MATEVATLGGGCFWCLEAVFEKVKGVSKVVSGYTGGHSPRPTYKEVCNGHTGHAEVIQVTFDPEVVSYDKLLAVFFTVHDPTTMNRQGADVGTQYRSAIFTHSDQQKLLAEKIIAQLQQQKIFSSPIVTEVTPIKEFFPAEDYHQGYFRNHPSQPYCEMVVAPKVEKFFKYFGNELSQD